MSTEREVGMAPGQIPGSAIFDFCEKRGMNVDDLDQFRSIIRSLDSDYLAHHSNRPSDNDNIVDSAPIDDAAGVSAILKRLGKKPST